MKGGKAEAEARYRLQAEESRYPLKLPLFTSPLEAGSSTTQAVSATDKVLLNGRHLPGLYGVLESSFVSSRGVLMLTVFDGARTTWNEAVLDNEPLSL